jgi:hypothetical protein
MKLLFTIVLIGAAVVLLGPVIATGVGFAFMLGCTFLWFLPFVLILFSDRASGGEKLAWILLMIFFSWFAWIFYFLLAPISRRHQRESHHYRSARERYYDHDRDYRYQGRT